MKRQAIPVGRANKGKPGQVNVRIRTAALAFCLACLGAVLNLRRAERGHHPRLHAVAARYRAAWPPPASSPAFPYDCARDGNQTTSLLAKLTQPPQQPDFPPWMTDLCPEVVAHFTAFPYFSRLDDAVPVMTSLVAAHLVCTVKLISDIATHSRTDVMLYAGSLIGALRHGGPVPWDDDMDLTMPLAGRDAFLDRCRALTDSFHPDISLVCQRHPAVIKIFIEEKCQPAAPRRAGKVCLNSIILSQKTPRAWRWPFADIFLHKTNATAWREVRTDGSPSRRSKVTHPLTSFSPSRQYYFGGITVEGPQQQYADAAYAWRTCRTGHWSHAKEALVVPKEARLLHLDCCSAARFVPFVVGNGTRLVGRDGRQAELAELM